MELDLAGKVVVITGAASGIGRVIAETFARSGSIVAALDISETALAEFGSAFREQGWPSGEYLCDVRDPQSVTRVMDEVVARFGRIDVLVNNAGINAEGLVSDLDVDLWDRCFAVNVRGTFNTCKAVLPTMKAQQSGRIINAASFAAIMPSVGASAYAASKAAVVQFTRTLAGEVGPWNITANSYAPGMVPTAINGFAELSEKDQAAKLDMLALRRWGTPDDVAKVVCFLASDLAGYVTGTLVDVSGGKFSTQVPSAAYEGFSS
ncbi:SDR family NAD(P)-dependent oxidoreductase [Mycetocola zhadangensis]|uniref:SDR family NAD(P)-dependent oxidoreductase n=1 Tax=Mycetocola zhadangensis TaxID=1164595 RepID=UPI003A4D9BEA